MQRGFDPFRDKTVLANYFRTIHPSTEYIAFEVGINDACFKAFSEAKKLVTRMGIGYTWEPQEEDLVLGTGGQGARPEQ